MYLNTEKFKAPSVKEKKIVDFVLHFAADLIEERGLQKGSYIGRDGLCILGAINVVISGNARDVQMDKSRESVDRMCAYLDKKLRRAPGSAIIQNWNDAPARTKEEVVAAMREAALS